MFSGWAAAGCRPPSRTIPSTRSATTWILRADTRFMALFLPGRSPEVADDLAPIRLERREVELRLHDANVQAHVSDPGLLEPLDFLTDLLGGADERETLGHLVGHRPRVGRVGMAVPEIVVV